MNTILVNRFSSPMGNMLIGANNSGICILEFDYQKLLKPEIIQNNFPNTSIIEGVNEHIVKAKKELEEYFQGTRKKFEVNVILTGSDFQKQVWQSLTEIPYGTTITYQQQAKNLTKPKYIRAIAHANGINRIAIIIPCHRVIGSNGKLTGYSGGIERKRWLINHERDHCSDPLKPLLLF